jgi:hypothetical protein
MLFGFRRRRSLLLTSRKLMIGRLGRPTPGPSLFRVLRAIPTVRRRLPLHPDKQIVTEPVATLHSCRQHTHAPLGRRAVIVAPREAELSSREVVRYLQSLPSKETCHGIDPHCRCLGAAVWRRRILRSPQGALVEFNAAASDGADALAANKQQLRYLNWLSDGASALCQKQNADHIEQFCSDRARSARVTCASPGQVPSIRAVLIMRDADCDGGRRST